MFTFLLSLVLALPPVNGDDPMRICYSQDCYLVQDAAQHADGRLVTYVGPQSQIPR